MVSNSLNMLHNLREALHGARAQQTRDYQRDDNPRGRLYSIRLCAHVRSRVQLSYRMESYRHPGNQLADQYVFHDK